MNFNPDSGDYAQDEFCAYVDGFNLYKGVLERRPDLKWLNLVSLAQELRPRLRLKHLYYFTAPLKERFPGDESPQMQEKYLRVLSNQGISVIRGKFRKSTTWLRVSSTLRTKVISPTVPGHFGLTQRAFNFSAKVADPDLPKAQVWKMEEKGSDVNLASYLLRDAYSGLKNALVISGDSDLVTPVLFSVEAGVDVRVAVPNRSIQTAALRNVASSLVKLQPKELRRHLLSRVFITTSGGNIVRPDSWANEERAQQ